jgi:hypothetical protein
MRRALGWAGVFVLLAVPAHAQGSGVSIGYSYLLYLEDGGGGAPLGFYLSLAGRGKTAIELDLAYHRDTGELVDATDVFESKLQTFTALAGFKVGPTPNKYGGGGGARPYFHILGGLRRDWLSIAGAESVTNNSWGGMTGLGVDIRLAEGFALRLAADFQMFWDEGESLKTLRFSAGFTF